MIYGRSALLFLATCFLYGGLSRGSALECCPTDRGHSAINGHSGASIVWSHSARPGGRAAVSRFIPWKNRIKSVLPETNDKVIDERDLGPAILPGEHVDRGTLPLAICPSPAFPHLRC
jgi:hypothetical protein